MTKHLKTHVINLELWRNVRKKLQWTWTVSHSKSNWQHFLTQGGTSEEDKKFSWSRPRVFAACATKTHMGFKSLCSTPFIRPSVKRTSRVSSLQLRSLSFLHGARSTLCFLKIHFVRPVVTEDFLHTNRNFSETLRIVAKNGIVGMKCIRGHWRRWKIKETLDAGIELHFLFKRETFLSAPKSYEFVTNLFPFYAHFCTRFVHEHFFHPSCIVRKISI